MDALIGTFHIDWKLMLAQIINFGIVFFVLYRFVIKPLSKTMAERKLVIEQGLSDAKKNEELLKQAEVLHAEELSKARAEAHALITDMKKTTEEKRAEMLLQAEDDVKKILEDGKKSIEEEKQKTVESLKKEIGLLILSATEKVLGTNLPPSVNNEVIQKSIDDLKKK